MSTVIEEPPIVGLCRWLKLLDEWATFYETDPKSERTPSREDLSAFDRAQSLYLLKERAILTLYLSQSPSVSLGILEGPTPKTRIWLCENCRNQARRANLSPAEYAELSGGCAKCQREGLENDYYSLYVLNVDYGALGNWQFHTPVPIGQSYFPAPRSEAAPVVGRRPVDRQGKMTRLGQPISAANRRQYPEHSVVWHVWDAIKTLKAEIV